VAGPPAPPRGTSRHPIRDQCARGGPRHGARGRRRHDAPGLISCANHDRRTTLDDRDLQFLHVLARIVCGELERAEIEAAGRQFDPEVVRALLADLDRGSG
jgi:hypothetical protein